MFSEYTKINRYIWKIPHALKLTNILLNNPLAKEEFEFEFNENKTATITVVGYK